MGSTKTGEVEERGSMLADGKGTITTGSGNMPTKRKRKPVGNQDGKQFGVDLTGTTRRVAGGAGRQATERFPTLEEAFYLPTRAVEGVNLSEGEIRQGGQIKRPPRQTRLARTERMLLAARTLAQALETRRCW